MIHQRQPLEPPADCRGRLCYNGREGQRSSVVEQLFRKQQVGSSILPVGSRRLRAPSRSLRGRSRNEAGAIFKPWALPPGAV